jgi:hypothetical protein
MRLERLGELLEELDREVRTLETARALAKVNVSPERTALAVRGLRHLLAAETEEAAQVFEALAEELRERTLPL